MGLADHCSRAGLRFRRAAFGLADSALMLTITFDEEVLKNNAFSLPLFNPVEEDTRASEECFMVDDFRSFDLVVLAFDDDSGNRSSSSLLIAANSADIRLRSAPSPKLSALRFLYEMLLLSCAHRGFSWCVGEGNDFCPPFPNRYCGPLFSRERVVKALQKHIQ